MTEETAVGDASPTPRRKRGLWFFLRDILFILLAALLISFLLKTFVIQSFFIPSGSMENTLQINDRVIVSRLTPSAVPLKRGDVVVFTDPGGWLAGEDPAPVAPSNPINSALAFIGLLPPDDNSHLIKRVIGLPGDKVRCCTVGGELTINGVAIHEPYIVVPPGEKRADRYRFSITVPKGDIWVMGDNRWFSADSAYHEANHDATPFVPISDVTGTAFVISWPASRWTWLGNYPQVFADVPKATN
jgi:signal peptidase I